MVPDSKNTPNKTCLRIPSIESTKKTYTHTHAYIQLLNLSNLTGFDEEKPGAKEVYIILNT